MNNVTINSIGLGCDIFGFILIYFSWTSFSRLEKGIQRTTHALTSRLYFKFCSKDVNKANMFSFIINTIGFIFVIIGFVLQILSNFVFF